MTTNNDDKAAQHNNPGFYRLREVLQIVPIRKSSLFRWIQGGIFPAPYKLGPRASAWSRQEVSDWCVARIEARESNPKIPDPPASKASP